MCKLITRTKGRRHMNNYLNTKLSDKRTKLEFAKDYDGAQDDLVREYNKREEEAAKVREKEN